MARVLVLGGSGNVGMLTVGELLSRGVIVRALVRSPDNFPTHLRNHDKLELSGGSLLDMAPADLAVTVKDCNAVVSCLGHRSDSPKTLCTQATKMVCDAIADKQANTKFIQLSGGIVNNPNNSEPPRGYIERGVIGLIKTVVAGAQDNQEAAEYLHNNAHTNVEWCVVRPSFFQDGERCEYISGQNAIPLFNGSVVKKTNIAHFIGELVTNESLWQQWRHKMPTLADATKVPKRG